MKKKLLALMASPNKGGNTDFLMDKFLEGVMDSEEDVDINKIYIRDLNIGHCIGCTYCERTGKCFQNDDMVEIYDELDGSDGIVFATPTYFGGVTSYGKTMIDRCQIYWSSKYVLKKSSIDRDKKRIGALISTVGAPEKYSDFSAIEHVSGVFFKSVNTDVKDTILLANTDAVKTWQNLEIVEIAHQAGYHFFDDF